MAEDKSLIDDLAAMAKGYQSMQERMFQPTVPVHIQVPPPPIPPPPPQSIPFGGGATPRSAPLPQGFGPSQQYAQAQRFGSQGPSPFPNRPYSMPQPMHGMNPAHGLPYGMNDGPGMAPLPPPMPPPLQPPPPMNTPTRPMTLGAPLPGNRFGSGMGAPQFGAPNPFMRGMDAALERGNDMQSLAMMSQAERSRYGGQIAAGMVANRVASTGGAIIGGGIGYGLGGGGGALTGADLGSAAGQMLFTRPIANSQMMQSAAGAMYRQSIDTMAHGAQIQMASRNFVAQGPETDISGRGFSSRASMRVARGLDGAAAMSQGRFSQQDMQNIMLAGADEGLFDGAQTSDALVKNVRKISTMLGTFAKITGDPDFRNNMRLMGQLKKMGVDVQDQTQFLSRVSGNANMAGKSMTQAIQDAQQSGAMYQQSGLLQSQGIDAGVLGQGLARQMSMSGSLSRIQNTRLGGSAGIADRFASISQKQLSGGLDAFMPYLVKKGENGSLSIDQDKLRSFKSGSISMNEMMSSGAAGMDSATLQAMVNNMGDLRAELAQKLGPSGALVATIKNVERVQQQLGGPSMASFQTAARSMGMSADEATQLNGLRTDPGALQGVMKANNNEIRRLRYDDQQRDAARRANRRTQTERFKDKVAGFIPFQDDVMDAYNDMQADFQRGVDANLEDAKLGQLGLRATRRDSGTDRLLEDTELNRSAVFERGLKTRKRRSSQRVGGKLFNSVLSDNEASGIAMAYDDYASTDFNQFMYGQSGEQMDVLSDYSARGTSGISQFMQINPRAKYREGIRDLNKIGNAAIDVKQQGPGASAAMASEAEAALDKAGIKDPATRRKLMASITAKLSASTRKNSSLLSGRGALQFNEVSGAVDEALSEAGVTDSAARDALLGESGQKGILSSLARFDTRGIESIEKTADSASKFRNAVNRRDYDGGSFRSAQSALQGVASKYGMGGMMSSKLSVNEQDAVKMVHAARKDKDLPDGSGAVVLILVANAVVEGDGEIAGDSTAIRTFQEMVAGAAKEDKNKAKALDKAFDRYSARMIGMYADRGSRPTVKAIANLKLDSVPMVETKDATGKITETYDTSAIAAASEEISGAAAAVSRTELSTKTRAMFRGTRLAEVGSGDASFAEDLRSTLSKTTNKDEQKKIIDMLKRNGAPSEVIGAVERAFETNDPSALSDSTVANVASVIMGEGGKTVTATGGVSTRSAETTAASEDASGVAIMAAASTFTAAVDKFGAYVDQSNSRSTMDTLIDIASGNPLNFNKR